MYMIQKLLENFGHSDHIYDAMEHEDVAEAVVAVKKLLESSCLVPFIENQTKSELTSRDYRQKGNESLKNNMFRTVLEYYNLALLHAPLNSQAMALAYGNRSALLFKVRAYSACLKDIEACLAIGGIENSIIDKLAKRKALCQRLSSTTTNPAILKTSVLGKYFQFDAPRHPQIPSVSIDVEVVMGPEGPKVVAARDIKVGTVVAIEAPFVGHLGKGNYYVACYYCHKMSLNLIPCRGCSIALFCDDDCLKRCNEEFHNIECKFIESLESISTGAPSRMKVKAVLKMRQKCKSWSELIAASNSIGAERMRNSSINEIYDVNNKFSLLNFNNTKHFVFGEAYNASFEHAAVISWLEKIKGFFPESPYERNQAVRAVARIMMQTYMFQVGLEVHTSANDQAIDKIRWQTFCNWGWFSFMGKLKHACDANLIQLGLKNDVALTALHHIKKGTELSISYLGHWYEDLYLEQNRLSKLFMVGQQFCQCKLCVEEWTSLRLRKCNLTREQKAALERWCYTKDKNFLLNGNDTTFNATCHTMGVFQNAANTAEHLELFKTFRAFTNFCQAVTSENVTLSNNEPGVI